MDFDYVSYGYIGKLLYTEDEILIYNVFFYGLPPEVKDNQLIAYFREFNTRMKLKTLRDSRNRRNRSLCGFVMYNDPEPVAMLLRYSKHYVNENRFIVIPCNSWQQPEGKNIITFIRKISKHGNVPCSSRSKHQLKTSILFLKDIYLENIFKFLCVQDKVNFGLTCRRIFKIFRSIAINTYTHLELKPLESLTQWELRVFFETVGPFVESIRGLCLRDRNYLLQMMITFINTYCHNVKVVKMQSFRLNETRLDMILENMKLLSNLTLKHVGLHDDLVSFLRKYSKIKSLSLDNNNYLSGMYIKKFSNLDELSLFGCNGLQSENFTEIVRKLTKLRHLDIRACVTLTTRDFNNIAMYLLKLESLKISKYPEDCMIGCVVRLPMLKKLEVFTMQNAEIEYTFFTTFFEIQTRLKLEELRLVGRNVMNPQKAIVLCAIITLKVLQCADSEDVDDSCLDSFTQFSELEELNISACIKVTNTGILKIVRNCQKLRHLDITYCTSVTETVIFDALVYLKEQCCSELRSYCLRILIDKNDKCHEVYNSPILKEPSNVNALKIFVKPMQSPVFLRNLDDDPEDDFNDPLCDDFGPYGFQMNPYNLFYDPDSSFYYY